MSGGCSEVKVLSRDPLAQWKRMIENNIECMQSSRGVHDGGNSYIRGNLRSADKGVNGGCLQRQLYDAQHTEIEERGKVICNISKELASCESVDVEPANTYCQITGHSVLNQQHDDLNQRCDDLNQQPDDLNQQPDDLNQQPDDLNQQPDDLNQQRDDLNQQYNRNTVDVSKVEVDNQTVTKLVNSETTYLCVQPFNLGNITRLRNDDILDSNCCQDIKNTVCHKREAETDLEEMSQNLLKNSEAVYSTDIINDGYLQLFTDDFVSDTHLYLTHVGDIESDDANKYTQNTDRNSAGISSHECSAVSQVARTSTVDEQNKTDTIYKHVDHVTSEPNNTGSTGKVCKTLNCFQIAGDFVDNGQSTLNTDKDCKIHNCFQNVDIGQSRLNRSEVGTQDLSNKEMRVVRMCLKTVDHERLDVDEDSAVSFVNAYDNEYMQAKLEHTFPSSKRSQANERNIVNILQTCANDDEFDFCTKDIDGSIAINTSDTNRTKDRVHSSSKKTFKKPPENDCLQDKVRHTSDTRLPSCDITTSTVFDEKKNSLKDGCRTLTRYILKEPFTTVVNKAQKKRCITKSGSITPVYDSTTLAKTTHKTEAHHSVIDSCSRTKMPDIKNEYYSVISRECGVSLSRTNSVNTSRNVYALLLPSLAHFVYRQLPHSMTRQFSHPVSRQTELYKSASADILAEDNVYESWKSCIKSVKQDTIIKDLYADSKCSQNTRSMISRTDCSISDYRQGCCECDNQKILNCFGHGTAKPSESYPSNRKESKATYCLGHVGGSKQLTRNPMTQWTRLINANMEAILENKRVEVDHSKFGGGECHACIFGTSEYLFTSQSLNIENTKSGSYDSSNLLWQDDYNLRKDECNIWKDDCNLQKVHSEKNHKVNNGEKTSKIPDTIISLNSLEQKHACCNETDVSILNKHDGGNIDTGSNNMSINILEENKLESSETDDWYWYSVMSGGIGCSYSQDHIGSYCHEREMNAIYDKKEGELLDEKHMNVCENHEISAIQDINVDISHMSLTPQINNTEPAVICTLSSVVKMGESVEVYKHDIDGQSDPVFVRNHTAYTENEISDTTYEYANGNYNMKECIESMFRHSDTSWGQCTDKDRCPLVINDCGSYDRKEVSTDEVGAQDITASEIVNDSECLNTTASGLDDYMKEADSCKNTSYDKCMTRHMFDFSETAQTNKREENTRQGVKVNEFDCCDDDIDVDIAAYILDIHGGKEHLHFPRKNQFMGLCANDHRQDATTNTSCKIDARIYYGGITAYDTLDRKLDKLATNSSTQGASRIVESPTNISSDEQNVVICTQRSGSVTSLHDDAISDEKEDEAEEYQSDIALRCGNSLSKNSVSVSRSACILSVPAFQHSMSKKNGLCQSTSAEILARGDSCRSYTFCVKSMKPNTVYKKSYTEIRGANNGKSDVEVKGVNSRKPDTEIEHANSEKFDAEIRSGNNDTEIRGANNDTEIRGDNNEKFDAEIRGANNDTEIRGDNNEKFDTEIRGANNDTEIRGDNNEKFDTEIRGANNDTEIRGDNNDTEIIGDNNDTEIRGDNNDTEIIGDNNDTEIRGTNNDTEIRGTNNNTEIRGDNNDAEIRGTNNDTEIRGDKNDTEIRGANNDTEIRGDNNDAEIRGANNDTEIRGTNNDTEIRCTNNDTEIRGTNNDAEIRGDNNDAEIRGTNNDTEIRGDNNDTEIRGANNEQFDTKNRSASSDTEIRSANNDTEGRGANNGKSDTEIISATNDTEIRRANNDAEIRSANNDTEIRGTNNGKSDTEIRSANNDTEIISANEKCDTEIRGANNGIRVMPLADCSGHVWNERYNVKDNHKFLHHMAAPKISESHNPGRKEPKAAYILDSNKTVKCLTRNPVTQWTRLVNANIEAVLRKKTETIDQQKYDDRDFEPCGFLPTPQHATIKKIKSESSTEIRSASNATEIRRVNNDTEIRCANNGTEIRGANSNTEIRGPSNDTEIRGASNDTEIKGTNNDTEIRGANNGTEIRGANNDTKIRNANNDTEIRSANYATEIRSANYATEIRSANYDTEIKGTNNDTEIRGANNGTEIRGANNDTEIRGASNGKSDTRIRSANSEKCDTEIRSSNNDTEIRGANNGKAYTGIRSANNDTEIRSANNDTEIRSANYDTEIKGTNNDTEIRGANNGTEIRGANNDTEIRGASNGKSDTRIRSANSEKCDTEIRSANNDTEIRGANNGKAYTGIRSANNDTEIRSANNDTEIRSANNDTRIRSANNDTEIRDTNNDTEVRGGNNGKSDTGIRSDNSEKCETGIRSANSEKCDTGIRSANSEKCDTGIRSANNDTEIRGANNDTKIRNANNDTEIRSANYATEIRSANYDTEIKGTNNDTEIRGANNGTEIRGANNDTEIRGASNGKSDTRIRSANSEKCDTEIRSANNDTEIRGANNGKAYTGIRSANNDTEIRSANNDTEIRSANYDTEIKGTNNDTEIRGANNGTEIRGANNDTEIRGASNGKSDTRIRSANSEKCDTEIRSANNDTEIRGANNGKAYTGIRSANNDTEIRSANNDTEIRSANNDTRIRSANNDTEIRDTNNDTEVRGGNNGKSDTGIRSDNSEKCETGIRSANSEKCDTGIRSANSEKCDTGIRSANNDTEIRDTNNGKSDTGIRSANSEKCDTEIISANEKCDTEIRGANNGICVMPLADSSGHVWKERSNVKDNHDFLHHIVAATISESHNPGRKEPKAVYIEDSNKTVKHLTRNPVTQWTRLVNANIEAVLTKKIEAIDQQKYDDRDFEPCVFVKSAIVPTTQHATIEKIKSGSYNASTLQFSHNDYHLDTVHKKEYNELRNNENMYNIPETIVNLNSQELNTVCRKTVSNIVNEIGSDDNIDTTSKNMTMKAPEKIKPEEVEFAEKDEWHWYSLNSGSIGCIYNPNCFVAYHHDSEMNTYAQKEGKVIVDENCDHVLNEVTSVNRPPVLSALQFKNISNDTVCTKPVCETECVETNTATMKEENNIIFMKECIEYSKDTRMCNEQENKCDYFNTDNSKTELNTDEVYVQDLTYRRIPDISESLEINEQVILSGHRKHTDSVGNVCNDKYIEKRLNNILTSNERIHAKRLDTVQSLQTDVCNGELDSCSNDFDFDSNNVSAISEKMKHLYIHSEKEFSVQCDRNRHEDTIRHATLKSEAQVCSSDITTSEISYEENKTGKVRSKTVVPSTIDTEVRSNSDCDEKHKVNYSQQSGSFVSLLDDINAINTYTDKKKEYHLSIDLDCGGSLSKRNSVRISKSAHALIMSTFPHSVLKQNRLYHCTSAENIVPKDRHKTQKCQHKVRKSNRLSRISNSAIRGAITDKSISQTRAELSGDGYRMECIEDDKTRSLQCLQQATINISQLHPSNNEDSKGKYCMVHTQESNGTLKHLTRNPVTQWTRLVNDNIEAVFKTKVGEIDRAKYGGGDFAACTSGKSKNYVFSDRFLEKTSGESETGKTTKTDTEKLCLSSDDILSGKTVHVMPGISSICTDFMEIPPREQVKIVTSDLGQSGENKTVDYVCSVADASLEDSLLGYHKFDDDGNTVVGQQFPQKGHLGNSCTDVSADVECSLHEKVCQNTREKNGSNQDHSCDCGAADWAMGHHDDAVSCVPSGDCNYLNANTLNGLSVDEFDNEPASDICCTENDDDNLAYHSLGLPNLSKETSILEAVQSTTGAEISTDVLGNKVFKKGGKEICQLEHSSSCNQDIEFILEESVTDNEIKTDTNIDDFHQNYDSSEETFLLKSQISDIKIRNTMISDEWEFSQTHHSVECKLQNMEQLNIVHDEHSFVSKTVSLQSRITGGNLSESEIGVTALNNTQRMFNCVPASDAKAAVSPSDDYLQYLKCENHHQETHTCQYPISFERADAKLQCKSISQQQIQQKVLLNQWNNISLTSPFWHSKRRLKNLDVTIYIHKSKGCDNIFSKSKNIDCGDKVCIKDTNKDENLISRTDKKKYQENNSRTDTSKDVDNIVCTDEKKYKETISSTDNGKDQDKIFNIRKRKDKKDKISSSHYSKDKDIISIKDKSDEHNNFSQIGVAIEMSENNDRVSSNSSTEVELANVAKQGRVIEVLDELSCDDRSYNTGWSRFWHFMTHMFTDFSKPPPHENDVANQELIIQNKQSSQDAKISDHKHKVQCFKGDQGQECNELGSTLLCNMNSLHDNENNEKQTMNSTCSKYDSKKHRKQKIITGIKLISSEDNSAVTECGETTFTSTIKSSNQKTSSVDTDWREPKENILFGDQIVDTSVGTGYFSSDTNIEKCSYFLVPQDHSNNDANIKHNHDKSESESLPSGNQGTFTDSKEFTGLCEHKKRHNKTKIPVFISRHSKNVIHDFSNIKMTRGCHESQGNSLARKRKHKHENGKKVRNHNMLETGSFVTITGNKRSEQERVSDLHIIQDKTPDMFLVESAHKTTIYEDISQCEGESKSDDTSQRIGAAETDSATTVRKSTSIKDNTVHLLHKPARMRGKITVNTKSVSNETHLSDCFQDLVTLNHRAPDISQHAQGSGKDEYFDQTGSELLQSSLECLLEMLLQRGKVTHAFIANAEGEIMAQTAKCSVTTNGIKSILFSLSSSYRGMVKIAVVNDVYTCFKHDQDSLVGRATTNIFVARRGRQSIVVGFSDAVTPGSCIKEVQEISELLSHRGL